MPETFTEESLAHFSGTENWHLFSSLFRNVVLTDGTLYLANNAGAFWLMDAIASHQRRAMQSHRLREFQLWQLKVNQKKSCAVLTCHEDSNEPALITQRIPYTDFPLESIKLYCNPLDDKLRCILLPSEY